MGHMHIEQYDNTPQIIIAWPNTQPYKNVFTGENH